MNNFARKSNIYPMSDGRKRISSIVGLKVVVLFFATLFYLILSVDLITNSQGLIAYTLLLLSYLYLEVRNLWKCEKKLFWINPVVVATIFTFVLAFGVTNIIFFIPEDLMALVGLEPIVTPWMNQLMFLVVLGACAMWGGYYSTMGRNMGKTLKGSHLLNKFMSTSTRINRRTLYVFLIISLIGRLGAIKLGVYGYSSTYDQIIANAIYLAYFSMAESLGALALIALAIECFALPRATFRDWILLGLVLCYEIAFGFISGLKSQVVVPFIIVGIVYYSQRNRLPIKLIPVVMVGIVIAYGVIEPFRNARNTDMGFDGTDLSSIAGTMVEAYDDNLDTGGEGHSTSLSVLSRFNYTYCASRGIEYSANNKLPKNSPNFLTNILLSPAHAIIPRFLWRSKPIQNIGLWYTNQVMGLDIYSATGMSPFTYLNFAGGPLAVVIGFFIVGIFQRGLFDGLLHFGGGGLIVLLGLFNILGNIDSAFNAFFVGIIRYLPILVVVQYFLIQPLQKPVLIGR